MTITTIAEQPSLVIANLSPDERSCPDCGVRTFNSPHITTLLAHARERINPLGIRSVVDTTVEFDFARCHTCEQRDAKAASLLNLYPATRMKLGSRSFAIDKLRSALAVLDIVGIPPKIVERLLGSERMLQCLIEELASLGAAASWSRRFCPVWSASSDIATCAAKPWSSVDEFVIARMRDGVARLLDVLMNRPVEHLCPSGEGCPLCGLGSISALRSQAEKGRLWVGPYSVQSGVLGGPRRPEDQKGYMCGACADAVARSGGGVGMAAVEQSIAEFLGLGIVPLNMGVVGLRAWAALPAPRVPNKTRWQHEANHAEIKEFFEKNLSSVTIQFT